MSVNSGAVEYIPGQSSSNIPHSLLIQEVGQADVTVWEKDMQDITKLYGVYNKGSKFDIEGTNGDYVAADLRFRKSANLINKEARFLFSKAPDIQVVSEDINVSKAEKEKINSDMSIFQSLVDSVLKANNFNRRLVQAARDCFVGKRIAIVMNFNEEGISLSFVPALNFVYEMDALDCDRLSKIVTFAVAKSSENNMEKRIYKKKYEMVNGICHVSESIYDGAGKLIEEILVDVPTEFDYIPAAVITNDGLTGDVMGDSEINLLGDYESWYSRLANADIDAERKGMNPTRYTIDASPGSTRGLSIAAGSYWDIATDMNTSNPNASAKVGILEPSMSYSNALKVTLDRMDNVMHEAVDVPNTSPESLKGVVSSGKTLKAIYWPLIVRCDEKMLAWRPALEFIAKTIIQGARLYPEFIKRYIVDALPETEEYSIMVENQYPLPEDEMEEKEVDIAEVNAQVMSRKSYMKKWRGLTDEEADDEIAQIALEQRMLEESYFPEQGEVVPPEPNKDDEVE